MRLEPALESFDRFCILDNVWQRVPDLSTSNRERTLSELSFCVRHDQVVTLDADIRRVYLFWVVSFLTQ